MYVFYDTTLTIGYNPSDIQNHVCDTRCTLVGSTFVMSKVPMMFSLINAKCHWGNLLYNRFILQGTIKQQILKFRPKIHTHKKTKTKTNKQTNKQSIKHTNKQTKTTVVHADSDSD